MAATVRPLSDELYAVAQVECNEQQSSNGAQITALKLWIEKSPYLKARTDELLLLAFLRRCRFSLEETKQRLDRYYSLRNVFPEVMNRQVDDALLAQIQRGIHIIPARPLSAQGPRVVISQFNKIDTKKSNPREAFKLFFMLLDLLALECDNAQVSGIFWLVDARDVSMELMLQFDAALMKRAYSLADQCMPLRIAEIHLINMRREGQAIFNFVTSFLPAKLPWKFVVHKKAEDLFEHLPREAMTIEYGGTNGYQAEALEYWAEKLKAYKDYFIEDAQYGTNEKLRVGLANAWDTNELSGVRGSFRKLEVD